LHGLFLSELHIYTVGVNEEETKPAPELEHPSRPAWRQLFKTTEGHILLLGIAVALVGLIVMGLIAFWSPEVSHMIGAMTFSSLVGRWPCPWAMPVDSATPWWCQ